MVRTPVRIDRGLIQFVTMRGLMPPIATRYELPVNLQQNPNTTQPLIPVYTVSFCATLDAS